MQVPICCCVLIWEIPIIPLLVVTAQSCTCYILGVHTQYQREDPICKNIREKTNGYYRDKPINTTRFVAEM